jgi:phosphopantothenoylcysteine decarboxylase/phosphopantothenate--cysteine ligase
LLEGRRIVLGVSGGIAAYKAVEVCRRLVDLGAHVTPVLTTGGRRMVGEKTFSALASEPVKSSLWDDPDPIPHTRMGQTADLVLVCPATARILADYRTGRSGDLLSATLIATRAPVVVCPAMHTEMWEHPAVQENLAVLAARGVHIVPPESGRLAGGDSGTGRLASPETVVAAVIDVLAPPDLAGVPVLVTAGGTREPIDPVRYVGNRSSGKQGHAIAEEARRRGAEVTLVTTVDRPASAGITVHRVETAAEMEQVVVAEAPRSEIIVMAAAVADFRPVAVAEHKMKKQAGVPTVVLEPTADILAALGRAKRPDQVVVGFAAETDDVAANAERKLVAKHLDLIVANDVGADATGFQHDTNAVTMFALGEPAVEVPLADKRTIAAAVIDRVVALRSARAT